MSPLARAASLGPTRPSRDRLQAYNGCNRAGLEKNNSCITTNNTHFLTQCHLSGEGFFKLCYVQGLDLETSVDASTCIKKKSDLFWTKLNQLHINVSLVLMQDVDFGTAAFNGGLKSVNSLVNRLKTG